jgi:flavodoxin I
LWKVADDGVVRMKVLVVYYSETGNTEKIARAIYEEASKEYEAHLKRVDEITVDILNDYDIVFLGSACHSTDLSAPIKGILEGIPNSSKFKLAGFFTHATSSEGFNRWASKCISSFQKTSKEKKINFKGYYNCQGAPSPPIQEFIKREVITSLDEWEKYIKEVMKHPTIEDLHEAREFARDILSQLD